MSNTFLHLNLMQEVKNLTCAAATEHRNNIEIGEAYSLLQINHHMYSADLSTTISMRQNVEHLASTDMHPACLHSTLYKASARIRKTI